MQLSALILGLATTAVALPQSFQPTVPPGQFSVYLYSEENWLGQSIGAGGAYKSCSNINNFAAKSIYLFNADRCRLWSVPDCPESNKGKRFTIDGDTAKFSSAFAGNVKSITCQQT